MNAESLLPENSLLRQFTNVTNALPDSVLARPNGRRFHRPHPSNGEGAPACNSGGKSKWKIIEVETALEAGKDPCRSCFRGVLQHYALDSESDVALRNGEPPDIEAEFGVKFGANNEPDQRQGIEKHLRLLSLTEKVLVKGGRSKIMHAPTPSGTLCGRRGGYRIADRQVVESHYDPCRNCFHVDDLDSYSD